MEFQQQTNASSTHSPMPSNLNKFSGDMVEKGDQYFYGKGKLLLTGEYFVLDGAKALSIPTQLGQSLKVRYERSFSPRLHWKCKDCHGNIWLEAQFEFWHFDIIEEDSACEEVLLLQKILRQAREQNSHFLRDSVNVFVETNLEFPLDWGLGSSSTLIYNIAQWAYISPFELLFKTYGGSGYDIACAQSEGPIVYQNNGDGPNWSTVEFNPSFKENLYFLHLGKKQNSREAIEFYNYRKPFSPGVVEEISNITEKILYSKNLVEFEGHIYDHEAIISRELDLPPVKLLHFSDFWGQIKSLGAWGGDFVLLTSKKSFEETKKYFFDKGYNTLLTYDELLINPKKTDYNTVSSLSSEHGSIH